jgi:hypothetical protein
LVPFVVDRSGEDIDDPHPGGPHLRPQALRKRLRRGFGRGEGTVRREIGERVDRQQVHPGSRARDAVGAARAHRRAEVLRQAQQAEVVDVHLGARRLDAVAAGNARVAMVLSVVHQDVDLAADLRGKLAHVLGIGDVERHERDLGEFLQFIEAREPLPRLCVAHPDELGARGGQRFHQCLPDGGLAVGDEHLSELGVAGEFAQLAIFGHVHILLVG